VLTYWMKIGWDPPAFAFALSTLGTVLLAVVAGIAASASALTRRPVEVLRNE
jgi:ABC-type lipoprotein release transport system permease subunit